ncbi:MAG: hypothetical protein IKN04_13125 [Clostridia bacterium]|nr:hypothetical protein [Clostridia bacterium]
MFPIHIETAFLSDLELVLGQMATEEKSNELTAIPKLLEILALKNCTVQDHKSSFLLHMEQNQEHILHQEGR